MNERRTRRSEDPYRALCLQLECLRLEGELDAVIVATDNGLLVASAGERSVCEALGAIAPLLSTASFSGRLPGALEGQRVDVRPMSLEGETVYLASVGRSSGEAWLQQSISGVRRILGFAPQADVQLLVN
ncbi:MAG: hypothetical protein OEV36_06500 [Myxococcales bacterium]|nr:hypothetical protein [Myxococcales bacterium]